MKIYAFISIHTYFNKVPFSVGLYRLTNRGGIYYWEWFSHFESILVYQINIAVSNSDISYYKNNSIPDILFDERHLECPIVESGRIW